MVKYKRLHRCFKPFSHYHYWYCHGADQGITTFVLISKRHLTLRENFPSRNVSHNQQSFSGLISPGRSNSICRLFILLFNFFVFFSKCTRILAVSCIGTLSFVLTQKGCILRCAPIATAKTFTWAVKTKIDNKNVQIKLKQQKDYLQR